MAGFDRLRRGSKMADPSPSCHSTSEHSKTYSKTYLHCSKELFFYSCLVSDLLQTSNVLALNEEIVVVYFKVAFGTSKFTAY